MQTKTLHYERSSKKRGDSFQQEAKEEKSSPLSYLELYDFLFDPYREFDSPFNPVHPRLLGARQALLSREIEPCFAEYLSMGKEMFLCWLNYAEYLLLRNKKDDSFLAVKCSKRGNDVYERRIDLRLGWLNQKIPKKEFFKLEDFKVDNTKRVFSSLLWVTLTYDPGRCSIPQAWKLVGKDFNRFISRLRSKYGRIHVLRVWESYSSGYPHIHVILLFESAKFSVFPHWKEKDGKLKLTFRIEEKDKISWYWHSHVDIQAISSTSALFTYLRKHQTNIITGSFKDVEEDNVSIGFNEKQKDGLQTLFLCWLFRKRSFSVSGGFRVFLSDLINSLHNSRRVLMQKCLDRGSFPVVEWELIGVFSGLVLKIPSFIWAKKFSRKDLEGVV